MNASNRPAVTCEECYLSSSGECDLGQDEGEQLERTNRTRSTELHVSRSKFTDADKGSIALKTKLDFSGPAFCSPQRLNKCLPLYVSSSPTQASAALARAAVQNYFVKPMSPKQQTNATLSDGNNTPREGLSTDFLSANSDPVTGTEAREKEAVLPRVSTNEFSAAEQGMVKITKDSPSTRKEQILKMVDDGICTQQAADTFWSLVIAMQSEIKSKSGKECCKCEEALRIARKRIQEHEAYTLQLQTEIVRLALQPSGPKDTMSSNGVSAYDVSRATREAQKVLALQQKVTLLEEQALSFAKIRSELEKAVAARETLVQGKQEEILLLQCREEEYKGKVRELEAMVIDRDEELRKVDRRQLAYHESQLEAKDFIIEALEAKLHAATSKSSKKSEVCTQTISAQMVSVSSGSEEEDVSEALQISLHEMINARDDAEYELQGLRSESEHIFLAASIVENKVQILETLLEDLQARLPSTNSTVVPLLTLEPYDLNDYWPDSEDFSACQEKPPKVLKLKGVETNGAEGSGDRSGVQILGASIHDSQSDANALSPSDNFMSQTLYPLKSAVGDMPNLMWRRGVHVEEPVDTFLPQDIFHSPNLRRSAIQVGPYCEMPQSEYDHHNVDHIIESTEGKDHITRSDNALPKEVRFAENFGHVERARERSSETTWVVPDHDAHHTSEVQNGAEHKDSQTFLGGESESHNFSLSQEDFSWASHEGHLALPYSGLAMTALPDGNQYIGEWSECAPHGNGIFQWTNGDVYTGQWSKGLRHGRGILATFDNQLYQGEWIDDHKHGMGVEATNDGKYAGSWLFGMRNGLGIATAVGLEKSLVEYSSGVEVRSTLYPPRSRQEHDGIRSVLQNARMEAKGALEEASVTQAICSRLDLEVE